MTLGNNKLLAKQGGSSIIMLMSITEITQLPLREKFQIMELLWADMSSRVESAGTPEDHKQLLDARRERAASGEAALLNWDRVKNTVGRA